MAALTQEQRDAFWRDGCLTVVPGSHKGAIARNPMPTASFFTVLGQETKQAAE